MDLDKLNLMLIDGGLLELCTKLNHLPFVETTNSCEGHINYIVPAGTDRVVLWHAMLMFLVNESHQGSADFLKDVALLSAEYSFAKFCKSGPHKDEYLFAMTSRDISDNQYLTLAQAQERKEEFDKVWSEFSGVADRHLSRWGIHLVVNSELLRNMQHTVIESRLRPDEQNLRHPLAGREFVYLSDLIGIGAVRYS